MVFISEPFHLNLLPVMVAPSRLLFVATTVSSPAWSIYPDTLEDVIELFLKVSIVGVLLGIITPGHDVAELVYVCPSMTNTV